MIFVIESSGGFLEERRSVIGVFNIMLTIQNHRICVLISQKTDILTISGT
jgi:hypothetical protein